MIPSLFIAASIRQACTVQRLQRAIRIAAPSVQIFDWTAAPGSQFFSFCSDACKSADLVVCYGHVGQEIGIQAGMAYMAGIPVLGIRDRQMEPGFMMESCVSRWVDDMADVPPLVARLQHCLSRIETYSPEADMTCPDCDLKSICRYFSLLADEDKRKV